MCLPGLKKRLSVIVGLLLVVGLATSTKATTYWVSSTGSNLANGLTPATAWRSLDNGELKGVIEAGDTVNILPGKYAPTATYVLNTSGTAVAPIVYRKHGKSPVVISAENASNAAVIVNGDHTVIDGLQFFDASDDCIIVYGDSCTVAHCYMRNSNRHGIRLFGNYTTVYRNVIYLAGDHGIKNEDAAAWHNAFYHNTIYAGLADGIALGAQLTTGRLFNNQVIQNNVGITGRLENVVAFNNVWGNPKGNLVGVADSAGGISRLPKFFDPAKDRFDLLLGSQGIDVGLDIGYSFTGAAPDMGAFEAYNVYYVSPSGSDVNNGLTPATAWATIDNGDSLLFPGDTVYVLPGDYTGPVVITDSGYTDQHIVYCTVPDSCRIDGAGLAEAVSLWGMHLTFCGFTVRGAEYANIAIAGSHNELDFCRIDSSGQYGLAVTGGTQNDIRRSVFLGNEAASALVTADDAKFFNCTFYDAGAFGVDALDAANCVFTNNVHQSETGTNTAIRALSNAAITYSAVHGYATTVSGGAALGSGSFTADPLLIDPAGGNVRLTSLSPAIDAGTNVGLPYAGVKPDLGAFETGVLASLEISPALDTLRADSQYQFSVVALDSAGFPADYGTLTWSHTFATGSISTDGLFTPQMTGSGHIEVVSSIGGVSAMSPLLTVVAGPLTDMVMTPVRDTVSSDSTLQFAVDGVDSRGNPIADIGTISWSVLNGIGVIDGDGLFTPTTSGHGFVRASSSLGLAVTSDTITVVPGALAHLQVLPKDHVMGVLQSVQFTLYGLDADSNIIKNLTDSAAWATFGLLGNVTSGGLFSSNVTVGTQNVWASYNGLADTATVQVTLTGGLSYVRIERFDGTPFGDTTLSTDNDSTILWCRGYTSANSLIGDVAAIWSVIGGDAIGSVGGQAATSATLALTRPGAGQVTALYAGAVADTSGTITCVAGLPDRIVVTPGTATVSADSSLLFDGQSVDADGNPSNPGIVVDWAVLGGIGTITSGGLFQPTTTGSGYIVASGAGLADTAGPITVTPGALAVIAVSPDSLTLPFDTTQQFEVLGYDSQGNACDAGGITWQVLDALGSIDASGLFTPSALGLTRIAAVSDYGPADTSALLEIVAGSLASLVISPDSVTITTDDQVLFVATGYDIGGNPTSTGALTWSILNDLGDINVSGLFTPFTVGVERIRVAGPGGLADTNQAVVITAGVLDRLVISPDTATVTLGDTLQFSVEGYDQTFNPTSVGTVSWQVNGGIGTIDSAGQFIATSHGIGSVTALSDAGVSETGGAIVVEALTAAALPIGTNIVSPGAMRVPVLCVRLENAFASSRAVTGLTVRNGSRGAGTPSELYTTVENISLYLDMDGDDLLSGADSLLATAAGTAEVTNLSFDSLTIPPGTDRTLLAGVDMNLAAHDGDSVDYFLVTTEDIYTADGSQAAGSDTLNSLGYAVLNGLVAAQIAMTLAADSILTPANQVYHLATIDLPRNGYVADTLDLISVRNLGSAGETDLDSMILYRDNGNGSWGGPAEETRLGKMAFTGTQWTRSGIDAALASAQTRFFIGVALAGYPTDGATITLAIPGNGIDMRSDNDGPVDGTLIVNDTITIRTNEQIEITPLAAPGHTIVPGANSGVLAAFSIKNTYQSARSLDSLRLTVPLADPRGATQALLDSQIDSLLVYIETDADLTTFAATDTVIGTATVSNGQAVIFLNGYPLPGAGATTVISAAVGLNLAMSRNGNTVAVQLDEASDFHVSPASNLTIAPAADDGATFTIDAFPAAAVTAQEAGVPTIFGGETDQPVLSIKIPGNGYASDTLRAVEIENVGSLDDAVALTRISLWLDRTGDGFSTGDSLLGVFRATALGTGYELTNLRTAVSPTGIHLAVLIDVALDRFEGGTAQFQVKTGGLDYRSGTVAAIMSGPDDAPVANPSSQLVVPSNRITAISIPGAGGPIRPGAEAVPLATFALYNGYLDQTKTLTAVALSNLTRSASTAAFADGEVGQVSLYYDADANRSFDNDSLIGSGYFIDGRLPLSGFSVTLPPESLSFFFVAADIPITVIDADSLAVAIAARSDFQFKEVVNLNGDLPLVSGSWQVIDGSVRQQFEVLPLSPQTVSPGDTLIPLMAFRPAANGDLVDHLTGLSLVNSLTADGSDIINVRLWRDMNDDDLWQVTDSSLGGLTYAAGQWSLSGLSLPMVPTPAALFITGDIAATATPNAAFEGIIPILGCQVESGNDGPVDSALPADGSFIISSSGLRVTYSSLPPTFSVGQPIAVRFTATNLLGSPINGVTGEIVSISDSSIVTPDSVLAGPINLPLGGSGEFVHYYTAAQAGSVSWRVRAVAAAPIDSSAVVQTASITVQNAPSSVSVQLINTAPTAVTRGQTNVFPMSLRLTHGDTATATASVRLDSLRLVIEDGAGTPQSAADVFDRVVLAAGYLNLTIIETVPGLSSLWLVFAEPIFLPAGQVQQFTLLVDIAPDAAADDFILSVSDESALQVVDRNSLQPVPINPAGSFPMKTAVCRIDDPSQELAVSNASPTVTAVNVGQQNVAMLTLGLRHPGAAGSSQIQVSSLTLYLTDSAGDTLEPSALLDRISVTNQFSQIGLVTGGQLGGEAVVIPFTTPVTLTAGETQSVSVLVTPAFQTTFTSLALAIPDSMQFVVRDLSSGAPLDVVTDKNVLATGSVFPLVSSVAVLRQPAEPPLLCPASTLPANLVGGRDSLSIARLTLAYPADNGHSSVVVRSVLVSIADTLQRPLDPDRLFDRMGYRLNAGVVYQGFVDLAAGAARFSFGDSGIVIAPGGQIALELIADIEADVPYDHFVALIQSEAALAITDATDTTHLPGVVAWPGCSESLPFEAGPAVIYLPAGRPSLAVPGRPVQLAYPGQPDVAVAELAATYQSPNLQGSVALSRVTGQLLRNSESGTLFASAADVFASVRLVIDGAIVAVDSALTGDSIILAIDSGYVISRGESVPLSIVADLAPSAPIGNYVLMFADSLFLEMTDYNLASTVYPVLSGGTYPLYATELSVSAPDLVNSFSNYPNPFVASLGEQTTIAYVLTGEAYVDIEIFTITGDRVATLLSNELKSAGAHQDLTWDGRTQGGLDLAPGTYFCRITARYLGGGTESARRKIAVVR